MGLKKYIESDNPLSIEIIQILISHREEDLFVDYKETFNKDDQKSWLSLTTDCMAFANTLGGYLVFGIRDVSFEYVGISEEEAIILTDTNLILQKINRYISPPITALRTRKYSNKKGAIGVIFIPESKGRTHIITKSVSVKYQSGKEKQILFILNDPGKNCHLRFGNENIVFEKDGEIINQLSVHNLLAIFVIGDSTLTTVLVRNCGKYGISLFLLKNNFELYGRLVATAEGNYLLRQKQYQLTLEKELFFAKMIIGHKAQNQLALLKKNKIISATDFDRQSNSISSKISKALSSNELLGLEGSTTKIFFSEYFREFDWYRRLPRTKMDINNFIYWFF